MKYLLACSGVSILGLVALFLCIGVISEADIYFDGVLALVAKIAAVLLFLATLGFLVCIVLAILGLGGFIPS